MKQLQSILKGFNKTLTSLENLMASHKGTIQLNEAAKANLESHNVQLQAEHDAALNVHTKLSALVAQ